MWKSSLGFRLLKFANSQVLAYDDRSLNYFHLHCIFCQKIIKLSELFPIKRIIFFTYGSFTVQWKGQKLAGKILLTWTKSLLVRSFLDQKPHQNYQLIADMFVFLTDRFGGRRVKIPSKITEFTFFGRKLVPAGNWATHCTGSFDRRAAGSWTLLSAREFSSNRKFMMLSLLTFTIFNVLMAISLEVLFFEKNLVCFQKWSRLRIVPFPSVCRAWHEKWSRESGLKFLMFGVTLCQNKNRNRSMD